jgi:hypothetical protein
VEQLVGSQLSVWLATYPAVEPRVAEASRWFEWHVIGVVFNGTTCMTTLGVPGGLGGGVLTPFIFGSFLSVAQLFHRTSARDSAQVHCQLDKRCLCNGLGALVQS